MPKRLTRADRLAAAQADIGSARADFEELRDELQSWLDNMPENLQASSKAEELQTAIDELEEGISWLHDAENLSVSFPSAR